MKNLLCLLLLLPAGVFAQAQKILVQGSGNNLYVNHTTAPKENFYSIGRIYNISPRVYAPYNDLDVDSGTGLAIGQELRIPLNDINFTREGVAEEGEVLVPLYHKVAAGEDVSAVSRRFGGVSESNLRFWNNLSSDQLRAGITVIIGHLKVKPDLSDLAKYAVKVTPAPAEKAADKPVAKTEPEQPAPQPVAKAAEEKKPAPQPETKPDAAENVKKTKAGEGKFSEVFAAQKGKKLKEEKLTAGLFKSSSGWNDEKYYCFHNKASIGSIVRITNPESGKSVYARVLDVIPDIGQNEGIGLRLSNAAAAALGVQTDTFDCLVAY